MRLSLLLGIAVSTGLCCAPAFAQQASTAAHPQPFTAPETGTAAGVVTTSSAGQSAESAAMPAPLTLRNGAVSTGLHGFYDYQSNGMLHGRLWVSPTDRNVLHTTYMLSLDGTDTTTLSNTRRVGYARSTDGGNSWQATREIQAGFRLGFPYLDVAADGTPYIACHGDPDGQGTRTLIYTGQAGTLNFTRTGTYERTSFTGRAGAQGAGVIWPGMVISPTDPTKQVVVATLSQPDGELPDPVHFSVAALGKNGPWDIISDAEVSTSSGGRNVIAKSPNGKVGVAYYHFGGGDSSGVYYTESTNGGTSWSAPVRVLGHTALANRDSAITDATLDMTFNGEEPNIVASGFTQPSGETGLLFVNESIFFWSPSKGTQRVALADSTRQLGVITVPAPNGNATKDQPSYPEMAYPSISVGDDGRHLVVVFTAAAQFGTDEEHSRDWILSEEGFFYHRLWAVGSPDGGATWGEPRLIQDFAGDGTDSATIEYPVVAPTGHVADNNFDLAVTFQARRQPGMYAFVVADVDTSSTTTTPADRGPITETFQYFQRVALDPPFFGEPASVEDRQEANGGLKFVKSFPNPASGSFTVSYELPRSGEVSLKVYNLLGSEVLAPVTAENGYPGVYTRTLDVSALAAGQYRVLLTQNGRTVSQPMTIVR